MQNPYPLPIRTRYHIHPPTPHIPTPLIQLHSTKRRPHFQPLEPVRLIRLAFPCPRLTIPHHHRAQALPRILRTREDCSYARAVNGWIAFLWHAQRRGRGVSAIQCFAEGPAAAGTDCEGCVEGVEDVVCSVCEIINFTTLTFFPFHYQLPSFPDLVVGNVEKRGTYPPSPSANG